MFHEQTVRSRMDKTIESLHQRIESLQLNGEVTPDMLRSVRVFAYGTQCSLDHMAMVASQDDNTLIVEPFDQSQISIIGRALINCLWHLDLGKIAIGGLLKLRCRQPKIVRNVCSTSRRSLRNKKWRSGKFVVNSARSGMIAIESWIN